MDKLRVTFVHKVSNPRDSSGNIPHAVMPLEASKLWHAWDNNDAKALGKYLRGANVLISGAHVREFRHDKATNTLHIFPICPGLSTYHHCVSICLTPTCEPLTSDKFLSLQAAVKP